MTVITVGHHFDVHGSVAGTAILLDKSHALLDGQNIHTVDTNSGNMISHFEIIIVRGMTINTGTHAVMVVFNAKNHGQFPQRRHVGGFPNLSLIGRTISVTGNGDIHGFARLGIVFIGKGQSVSDGYLGTDNSVSAVKVVFLVVKMHGSTLGRTETNGIAKQFAHHLRHRSTPGQGDAMASVGGNPGVGLFQRKLNSGSDGFLSIVQMTKSTNIAGLVFVVTGNFHTTHRVHQFKHLHQFVLGGGDGIFGFGI
mmetsp:Transcript_18095/g.25092  ORF Transcript_18095/g.25092 Transcript_18095/m.25092 type:complete len:253 (-) Transcript_18095:286-1044(-)